MKTASPKRVTDTYEVRQLLRQAYPVLSEAEEALRQEGALPKSAATFSKVAGEVIFRKDRGGDEKQWAYGDVPPSERTISETFNYSPKNIKPLAKVLRATLAALGHALSGYQVFAKTKSARISPDGSLGGKGYIQKISDMRRQYMNVVEALSALSDTLYDEVNAPHWSALSRQEDPQAKAEVRQMMDDVEEIREDPQEWAEEQLDEEEQGQKKTAATLEDTWWSMRGSQ